MQAMRDLLRGSLAKSLDALTPNDRVAAAWPVAAGHAVASRTSVLGIENGVVTIEVPDKAWGDQLWSVRDRLRSELASVSRLPLTDILFVVPPAGQAPSRKTP